nr:tRNA (guanosine(18)-2'-O)-methyltransferase-like [Drosophila kikkawai]
MGSTRSTRILAQLILHKLAVKCKEKSFCIHLAEVLVQKVEKSLGEKLPDLQSDPRLWLAELTMDYDMSDCILYITNPPFDEIGTRFSSSTHGRQYNRFKKIGQAFAASKLASSGEVAPPQTRSEGLTLPPTDANNSGKAAGLELILVASLLGGEINFPALRRTCEKFGFHSLVVADESHLAEASSGNLSIVKVKSENLVEFILAKQAEGYKAVSSKGSAGTPKFDHFEFPKKCILVLGHENNGIPINVAGVLDYVVEIPQFGFLDTNFGASLLIWEFFKQHCA